MTHDRFDHPRYTIRKKILTLVGAKFHVFDPAGAVVLFARLKGFRIREDIRLHANETTDRELLRIHARHAFDVATTYDVVDAATDEPIGALKRRGLRSIVRDEWLILDPGGAEVGVIREDSSGLALLRRFLGDYSSVLVPQRFHAELGGEIVARYAQNRNPFVWKLEVDFGPDRGGRFDRRMGLAAGVLLLAIEGRQS